MQVEKELTEVINLCQENGRLHPEAVGWSRKPLHTCNLSGRWPRKKRWNYWAVTSENHLFSVTVSNVDYVGLVFVYVADFANDMFNEMTQIVPLGRGCNLPDTVDADVVFAHKGLRVDMVQTENGVQLAVDIANFAGVPLTANIAITTPPHHESLNVVVPWDEQTFQFTSKQNTLPSRRHCHFWRRNHPVQRRAKLCLPGLWAGDLAAKLCVELGQCFREAKRPFCGAESRWTMDRRHRHDGKWHLCGRKPHQNL